MFGSQSIHHAFATWLQASGASRRPYRHVAAETPLHLSLQNTDKRLPIHELYVEVEYGGA